MSAREKLGIQVKKDMQSHSENIIWGKWEDLIENTPIKCSKKWKSKQNALTDARRKSSISPSKIVKTFPFSKFAIFVNYNLIVI